MESAYKSAINLLTLSVLWLIYTDSQDKPVSVFFSVYYIFESELWASIDVSIYANV